MTKLQCSKCGYIKEYFDTDIIQNEKCELCGGNMVLAKKELGDIVEQNNILRMEQQIKELGHKRVWEIVEGFAFAKTRLSYRKLFFEAGGIVPKSNL